MKIMKILEEKDITMIICKHFDVAPSKVNWTITKVGDDTAVEISVETDKDIPVLIL